MKKKQHTNENNKHNIYALPGDCHKWYKNGESNGLLHIFTFEASAWSVVYGSKTGKYMISDSNSKWSNLAMYLVEGFCCAPSAKSAPFILSCVYQFIHAIR